MKIRTQEEITSEIDKLYDMVWYERKLVMFHNIQKGIEKMPLADIYDGMIKQMKRIKKELKYDGVEDDFDWGMINGKLSALRWVMGDEWDDLDT